jgi:SAM-dependent methyltransferase
MTRREKVLRHIDPKGYGIEIGPSHNPIAPKRDGYNVHIIDHISKEELIEKYREHNVKLDNIEDVDFIWREGSYSDLIGKSKHYDWIIASHVIEHTPDLITCLNDCDSILKDDGVLSLVIPDKRYCFDHFRPITGISRIIDSNINRNVIHTPWTVVEYFLNVVSKSDKIAWNSNEIGEYKLIHCLDDAIDMMNIVVNDKTYLDVHAWCFVPTSFRLIINDLFDLGLISLKELDFCPTENFEFFVTLSRRGAGSDKPRLELLSILESELRDEMRILDHALEMPQTRKGWHRRLRELFW